MNFNKHFNLQGQHALLSPSKHYWLNYEPDKLEHFYSMSTAAQKGTEIHDFAAKCIKLKQKLPRSKKTLNAYVNDAIGYRMNPEQILFYSAYCFGTADAISFKNNFLRIHDLKTGTIPAHIEQLKIYAALFCLEYNVKPKDISTELRIYQNDNVLIDNPEADELYSVIERVKYADRIIKDLVAREE